MSLPEIQVCPGTLAKGYSTYSPSCRKRMFHNRKVSHILPFASPGNDEAVAALFLENRERLSISGVQEKLSMVLEKNKLRLTLPGEKGTYLLKPIPRDLKKVAQVPANEHLTMQIARQVYGIPTAENALVFFADGAPAYLTLRFDVRSDGAHWGVEDFASLAGKTAANSGENFKYNFSYEEMGSLLRKFVPAWRVEIEKFYVWVLFNYLFSNGDAHLKNFSLMESPAGDYLLSPAYDLINTRIHVNDTDFALDRGLFADGFRSPYREKTGHPSKTDFEEFASRIGILDRRLPGLLNPFLERQALVEALIQQSFLDEETKKTYFLHYQTKRNHLLKG